MLAWWMFVEREWFETGQVQYSARVSRLVYELAEDFEMRWVRLCFLREMRLARGRDLRYLTEHQMLQTSRLNPHLRPLQHVSNFDVSPQTPEVDRVYFQRCHQTIYRVHDMDLAGHSISDLRTAQS